MGHERLGHGKLRINRKGRPFRSGRWLDRM